MPARRVLRFAVVGVIVSLVVGYGSWSALVWAHYTPRYGEWQRSLRTSVDTASALPIVTDDDRRVALETLTSISQRIDNDNSTICSLHPLMQWQTTLASDLRQRQLKCQQVTTGVAAFNELQARAINHLEFDRALVAVLQSTPGGEEFADTAWADQMAVWANTAKEIGSLEVGADIEPVRQRAVSAATEVRDAWQEVIASSDAKDKVRFAAAKDKLSVSYGALNDITTDSERALARTAIDLQRAYNEAF